MVVDEGHRLKNRNSRAIDELRLLRARRKLVLTGTATVLPSYPPTLLPSYRPTPYPPTLLPCYLADLTLSYVRHVAGTPLQNHVTELWTILNFLEPIKFDDLDRCSWL